MVHEVDIRAFARRDWAALNGCKARFWAERKRAMTAGDALELGDTLRLRPDWPDPTERAADLTLHARVAEALRAVSIRSTR
jgi:hypothetical protein